jgi:hypothetical protein
MVPFSTGSILALGPTPPPYSMGTGGSFPGYSGRGGKLTIYLSIHLLPTYLSMALQYFVGPWPLLQFLNLMHSL